MKFIIGLLILTFSICLNAQENVLSDNTPEDLPVSSASNAEMEAFFNAQKPYNKIARDSFPQSKARFIKGLPKGENFFLTTRLHDEHGRVEQVFVLVKSFKGNIVESIIYNDIQAVSGYKNGQKHSFPESEVYDWLITKPDGSEEGNFVGKFIDSLQSAGGVNK